MKNSIINKIWPQWQITKEVKKDGRGTLYEAEKEGQGPVSRSMIRVLSVPENVMELRTMRHEMRLDDKSLGEALKQKLSQVLADIKRAGHHTSLVSIYEVESELQGSGPGWHLLQRMEPLRSLRDVLGVDSLRVADVVKLGISISSALSALEDAGVVHGHVSPDSIYLSDSGEFKLGDVGFSHIRELLKVNKADEDYRAPEDVSNRSASKQGDIYSLGLVLYQLLNDLRLPFAPRFTLSDDDRERLQSRRLTGETAPSAANADDELDRILASAIEYDPSQRISASELHKALVNYEKRISGYKDTPVLVSGSYQSVDSSSTYDMHTDEKHVYEHRVPMPSRTESSSSKTVLKPSSKNVKVLVPIIIAAIALFVLAMSMMVFRVTANRITTSNMPLIEKGRYEAVRKGENITIYYPDEVTFDGKYTGDQANGKPHGYGAFTNQDKKNAWTYVGGWKDGLPSGQGAVSFQEGTYMEGIFQEGELNGKGILYQPQWGEYQGEFKNGLLHGHGMIRYENGGHFEGEFVNDVASGPGKMTYADGNVYEGNYEEGYMQGEGVLNFHNGDVYQGQFLRDKYQGKGLLIWANGDRYEGDYHQGQRHGFGVMEYVNGQRYEGEFFEDKRQGKGRYTWPDGEAYEGEWVNEQQNGQGTHYFKDGAKYAGEFKDGYLDGYGEYWYANGNFYVGEFAGGQKSGFGTYTWVNGDVYFGNYADDLANGTGTMVWNTGEKYDGEWKNGRSEGQGTMYWPNGNYYIGEFADGELHGQGVKYDASGNVIASGQWSKGEFVE